MTNPPADKDEWAQRRATSIRIAWALAGVAVAIFFLAIWKYRPA